MGEHEGGGGAAGGAPAQVVGEAEGGLRGHEGQDGEEAAALAQLLTHHPRAPLAQHRVRACTRLGHSVLSILLVLTVSQTILQGQPLCTGTACVGTLSCGDCCFKSSTIHTTTQHVICTGTPKGQCTAE